MNYPHGCCGTVVFTKKCGDYDIFITNFQSWGFQQFHENFEPRKFGAIQYISVLSGTFLRSGGGGKGILRFLLLTIVTNRVDVVKNHTVCSLAIHTAVRSKAHYSWLVQLGICGCILVLHT